MKRDLCTAVLVCSVFWLCFKFYSVSLEQDSCLTVKTVKQTSWGKALMSQVGKNKQSTYDCRLAALSNIVEVCVVQVKNTVSWLQWFNILTTGNLWIHIRPSVPVCLCRHGTQACACLFPHPPYHNLDNYVYCVCLCAREQRDRRSVDRRDSWVGHTMTPM